MDEEVLIEVLNHRILTLEDQVIKIHELCEQRERELLARCEKREKYLWYAVAISFGIAVIAGAFGLDARDVVKEAVREVAPWGNHR